MVLAEWLKHVGASAWHSEQYSVPAVLHKDVSGGLDKGLSDFSYFMVVFHIMCI